MSYNPSQPRDENGMWRSRGAGGGRESIDSMMERGLGSGASLRRFAYGPSPMN